MTDDTLQDGDEYPPDEPLDVEDDEELLAPPTPRASRARRAALQRGKTTVNGPKTVNKSGKRILSRQKQRQALELRKAGASYAQIAEQLGYKDASGASKAVKRAFGNVIQEPVTDLKAMQIERLNHMLLIVWPKVQAGDDKAIHTARGLMNDLNDLMGTRESQNVGDVNINQNNILVIDGDETEYIQAMKRMAGLSPDGSNQPIAISTAPVVLDTTVIDAEVVEDHEGDIEVVPTVEEPKQEKKFNFGVDPTVRREQKSD